MNADNKLAQTKIRLVKTAPDKTQKSSSAKRFRIWDLTQNDKTACQRWRQDLSRTLP
jgi:hypothetical protein